MKLNLGAGKEADGLWLEGYENIDTSRRDAVKFMKAYPLDFPDESCEEIRASHVLEHFSFRETVDVLQDWIRVLKPGGWLKIAVPDFRYIAEEYLAEREDLPLMAYLMGGHVDENDYHKAIFDEGALREGLEELGLLNVQHWQSEIPDCATLPVSLNLMGQKPEKSEVKRIQPEPGEIVAVMSMPRLAFTDTLHCTMNVLHALKFRVLRSSGVFWGQCLQNLFNMAIEGNPKYILTIDYDSLFSPEDVLELYRIAEETGADALCALQTKRESASPLFCLNTKAGGEWIELSRKELESDTYPIVTGHFGLTLLRVSALQDIEKPWFLEVANPLNGEFDEGRMDSDITFWHKFKEAEKQLYLAPNVTIGHLQIVATWPDKSLQARHQYAHDYNANGKPPWAWT